MNGKDDGITPKSNSKKKRIDFMIEEFNDQHRPSVVSTFSTNSVLSASEVTEEALDAWKALPDEIRQDPSLISFRRKYETTIGKKD